MQGHEFIGAGKVAVMLGKFGDIAILCKIPESKLLHIAISRKHKYMQLLFPDHKFIVLDTEDIDTALSMLKAIHPIANIKVIQIRGIEIVDGYRNYQAYQEGEMIEFVNS